MASTAVAVRRAAAPRRITRVITTRSRRSKAKFTLPLAVVAGFGPIAMDIGAQVKDGNWQQAGMVLEHNLIGYNGWSGKMDTAGFSHGLYPILVGFAAHWGAGKIGLNRAIARARIPFLRI